MRGLGADGSRVPPLVLRNERDGRSARGPTLENDRDPGLVPPHRLQIGCDAPVIAQVVARSFSLAFQGKSLFEYILREAHDPSQVDISSFPEDSERTPGLAPVGLCENLPQLFTLATSPKTSASRDGSSGSGIAYRVACRGGRSSSVARLSGARVVVEPGFADTSPGGSSSGRSMGSSRVYVCLTQAGVAAIVGSPRGSVGPSGCS